jgi:hypothetical protein
VSKLDRNVPFFAFRFCCLFIVGLACSEALRSPKGGAFRAKRRARPTMPGPRRLPPFMFSFSILSWKFCHPGVANLLGSGFRAIGF